MNETKKQKRNYFKTILFVLPVMAFILFTYARTTPHYSLIRLTQGIKTNNPILIARYVNIDKMIDSSAEEIQEYVFTKFSEITEDIPEDDLKTLTASSVAQLKKDIKQSVSKNLRAGKKITGTSLDSKILDELSVISVLKGETIQIEQSSGKAKVTVSNNSGDKLVFILERENLFTWRVVEWENLKEVLDKSVKKGES